MAEPRFERTLSRAGALLVFLALLVGLAIPSFTNPRQAMAAHVSAIMTGLLLIGLGTLWGRLSLSASRQALAMRLAIGGAYANLVGSLLAAAWGTNRFTPLAGVGHGGEPWQEAFVQVIQVSQAIALIVSLGLVVHGLRGREPA
jgi:hydroxylaminobenzene mutase